MKYCQVVGVRNLADAVGVHCTHKAIDLCFDCGIHVCESHAESCHICQETFCASCLTFNQRGRLSLAKPVRNKHRERKTA
jgi:hypothetical protein